MSGKLLTEPLEGLDYVGLVHELHERVLGTGIHRDLLFEGSELSGYRILITPFVPYLSTDLLARAAAFVDGEGTWIVGPLSGTGALGECFGMRASSGI